MCRWSLKALTGVCPPTSCLSSMTPRRWNSSHKSLTKCQYLRSLLSIFDQKVPQFEVTMNIVCQYWTKRWVTNKVPIFEVTQNLQNLFYRYGYAHCRCDYLNIWILWILWILQVSHIDPGSPIKLHLYAENAKGTSEPAIIDDALSSQHKHYVEGDDDVGDVVLIMGEEWARNIHDALPSPRW